MQRRNRFSASFPSLEFLHAAQKVLYKNQKGNKTKNCFWWTNFFRMWCTNPLRQSCAKQKWNLPKFLCTIIFDTKKHSRITFHSATVQNKHHDEPDSWFYGNQTFQQDSCWSLHPFPPAEDYEGLNQCFLSWQLAELHRTFCPRCIGAKGLSYIKWPLVFNRK